MPVTEPNPRETSFTLLPVLSWLYFEVHVPTSFFQLGKEKIDCSKMSALPASKLGHGSYFSVWCLVDWKCGWLN